MLIKNIFRFPGRCNCGRPKPKEDVFEPWPKQPDKKLHNGFYRSSSSSWERSDDHTTSTYSFNNHRDDTSSMDCSENGSSTKMVTRPFPKFGDSIAVVKDSDDPYDDFRQSMLQMIFEKEIYSRDELRELLNCFLELNSSSNHKVIVQAFMDIWNGVVSKNPKSPFSSFRS